MSLTALQRVCLIQEGLVTITDFADFDEDTLNDAFKNMKFSQPGDLDTIFSILPVVGVPLSAKQKLCIHTAHITFKYLTDTNYPINPQSMNYNNSLKDFCVKWDSIVKLEEQKTNELLTMSCELQVM